MRQGKDPWMATVVERLGRYITLIQVMGKGYKPFSAMTTVYSYEVIAVLHMDRIRAAPKRIPRAEALPPEVLRIVWESDQVPAGGQTLKSKKGQALARAKEEMRIAHIKEA